MRHRALRRRPLIALAFATALIGTTTTAPRGAEDGEWRSSVGGNAGLKYSPLDQINKSNLKDVTIVWRQSAVVPTRLKDVGGELVALALP